MAQYMKWWGWGAPDKEMGLDDKPAMLGHLTRKVGISGELVAPPVERSSLELPASRLTAAMRKALVGLVGEDGVEVDDESRLVHAMGKSYRDLIRARRGHVPRPPDAVVLPGSSGELAAVLAWCGSKKIGVIPFGGGTSVVGGVELVDTGLAAQICLDTTRMRRLLELDPVSRTARFEAGVLGPDLEAQLGERGHSLGHFPQSFEFSTLGGWLAARSAGQNSSRYGKIEDMVEAVTLLYPGGRWETRPIPARSSGPEWRELLVGSEGVLGVISEATVRVHPIPEAAEYRAYLFRSFAGGLDAVRELAQDDVHPTIVRMNDADYTEMAMQVLSTPTSGVKGMGLQAARTGLGAFGYGIPGACLLLVGFEGPSDVVSFQTTQCRKVCLKRRALGLGTGPGLKWKKERFEHPYLRDDMMSRGILVETLETATNWGDIHRLYDRVRAALRRETGADRGSGLVLTHCSHVYPEGGSLYFTFMTRAEEGRELDQWARIKEAASDAILGAGGTISHHHGVGMDHARWMAEERGPAAMEALRAIKATVDPNDVLNPGKLGVGGAPATTKAARKPPRKAAAEKPKKPPAKRKRATKKAAKKSAAKTTRR